MSTSFLNPTSSNVPFRVGTDHHAHGMRGHLYDVRFWHTVRSDADARAVFKGDVLGNELLRCLYDVTSANVINTQFQGTTGSSWLPILDNGTNSLDDYIRPIMFSDDINLTDPRTWSSSSWALGNVKAYTYNRMRAPYKEVAQFTPYPSTSSYKASWIYIKENSVLNSVNFTVAVGYIQLVQLPIGKQFTNIEIVVIEVLIFSSNKTKTNIAF